ncbi:MAG: hypothetical protein COA42_04875 [Alteromonadaceae bacterium]|nr:MAG: hypothetical protein COA42_04875 [Alteromonadaceae bacterium]
MLELIDKLKNILSTTLYLDSEFDEGKTFAELGMDSITGVEFVKQVNHCFNTSLKQAKLYDFPTLEALANYLLRFSEDQSKPDPLGLVDKTSMTVPAIDRAEERDNMDDDIFKGLHQLLVKNLYLDNNFDESKTFAELGMDSITGVEFIRTLNQSFAVDIKQAKLYDYPTVQTLAAYIHTFKGKALGKRKGTIETDNTPIATGLCVTELCDKKDRVTLVAKQAGNSGDAAIVETITEILCSTLFLDNTVDISKSFAELGMDSITGVEFLKHVNQHFSINIKQAKLYDYPDLSSLSNYVGSFISEEPSARVLEEPSACELEEPSTKQPSTAVKAVEKIPNALKSVKHAATEVEIKAEKKYQSKKADIAILGMSARLPGAENIEVYWENLKSGTCSVTEVPKDRWDVKQHFNANPQAINKTYSKWGGFLNDIDKFDAEFFNITAFDADHIDPQQRLALQEAYRALDHAGYSNKAVLSQNTCGVYIGVMSENEYAAMLGQKNPAQVMVGNSNAILAGRIAYALDLKGPVITLDTACSSSLVAIHLACQSLINEEADLMLAGGVTLYLTEKPYIGMSKAMMLAADGLCKTFDNTADGFVPGEGVGFVVLKTLKKATADGDTIYGVIKGSGINQDGKTNGLTAPNGQSQSQLQTSVYRKYAINPQHISYVETHGTGTKLGDPIEVGALSDTFSQYTDRKQFCAIGAVKSNIGHTSAAAGVASLIKVLLSMKHKMLPPSLHVNQENEHIGFSDTPFYINRELTPWKTQQGEPRLAAINAFGFSGTNAHLVVSDYHSSENGKVVANRDPRPEVFILSARNSSALSDQVKQLHTFLVADVYGWPLHDMAYSLQVGREAMANRLAIVADSKPSLIEKLEAVLHQNTSIPGVFESSLQSSDPIISVYNSNANAASLFFQELIQNNKYADLAKLWVAGINIPWQRLHRNEQRKRVGMPSYAFKPVRHWLPQRTDTVSALAQPESPEAAALDCLPLPEHSEVAQRDGVLIEPVWQQSPWTIQHSGVEQLKGLTLVFDDGVTRAQELCERHILIQPGEYFKKIEAKHYQLAMDNEDDYRRLWLTLVEEDCVPEHILYLLDLAGDLFAQANTESRIFCQPDDSQSQSSLALQHAIDSAVKPLFMISKYLLTQVKNTVIDIYYFYRQEPQQEQAARRAMAAFFRTVTQESTLVSGKVIAIENLIVSASLLKNILQREIEAGNQHEVELVYTPQARLSLKYQEITHSSKNISTNSPTKLPAKPYQSGDVLANTLFKQKGHYLITGGLGGIGWSLARYLLERYQARLTLWDVKQPNAEQLQVINEVNQQGVKMEAVCVTLEDYAAVDSAMQDIDQLDGIFHLAGRIKPDLIANCQWQDFSETLAPKTCGSINLDFASKQRKLDFFVLFSSVGAVNGGVAYCDYVYANYFMDVFASQRQRLRKSAKRSGLSLSINWEFWQDGGMALPKAAMALLNNSLGYDLLKFSDGMELLELSLLTAANNEEVNQLLALNEGGEQWTSKILGQGRVISVNNTSVNKDVLQADGEMESSGDEAVSRIISEVVKEFVQTEECIDMDKHMLEYGVDSITRLSIINRINERLGLSLNASAALMNESFSELSHYVLSVYREGHQDSCQAESADKISVAASELDASDTESGQAVAKRDDIAETIVSVAREFVRIDGNLDLDKHMLEYGIDSITRLSLINRINEELQLSMNASAAIMHESLGDLIEFVAETVSTTPVSTTPAAEEQFNTEPKEIQIPTHTVKNKPFMGAESTGENGSVWQMQFNASQWPELTDFENLFHTGLWQEVIANALQSQMGGVNVDIENLSFVHPLFIKPGETKVVQMFFDQSSVKDKQRFRLLSKSDGDEVLTLHIKGVLNLVAASDTNKIGVLDYSGRTAVNAEYDEVLSGTEFYARWGAGRKIGAAVCWVDELTLRPGDRLAKMRAATAVEKQHAYALPFHPGILESCGQLFYSFLSEQEAKGPYWTMSWRQAKFSHVQGGAIVYPLWCHATCDEQMPNSGENPCLEGQCLGDFTLFDDQGTVLFQATGCLLKRIDKQTSLGQNGTLSLVERQKWFAFREAERKPKMRLFCFSYGFGGPSVYFDWVNALGDDIEVCPVLLPGRETRINEPFTMTIEEVVDSLIDVLLPDLTVPFAFYGHCVGGLLAFLLAKRLEQRGIYPTHLFVGAYPAPLREPITFSAKLFENLTRWNDGVLPAFDDVSVPLKEKVRDYLKKFMDLPIIQDEDKRPFFDVLFSTLLADTYLQQSFNYAENTPIKCPIYAMGSWQDEHLGFTEETIQAWRELTTGVFNCEMFDGNHYFLHADQEQEKVLGLIKNTCDEVNKGESFFTGQLPPKTDEKTQSIDAKAEFVPTCVEILEQILPEDIELQENMLNEEMDNLLLNLLLENFSQLGFLDNATPMPGYQRWYQQSIEMFQQVGFLDDHGDVNPERILTLSLTELWQRWDEAKTCWQHGASQAAQLNLLETCVRALPEVLTGKKQATEVMFPNGSMALVEGIYRDNPIADYYNQQLETAVVAYIQLRLQKNPSARFRVLEIGAGTGGTTKGILAKLEPYQHALEEYCYTDLCQAFLVDAQKRYAQDHPYVVTRLFNVEAPIWGHEMKVDSYDIVIAANVIHATKNIQNTLRNIKSAMRKNGMLFMNEISRLSVSAHLTFGLLEGWWLYEDTELRIPGCPGLSADSWGNVLNEEGFVLCSAKSQQAYGQQIVIAENNLNYAIVDASEPEFTLEKA